MKMFKINAALVLCAGYGKRLNPLTLKNPKPLLKLNNLTLLENTINLIKKLGINEIKLNTFSLKDQIKIFIEEKNFDVKIKIIEDGNEILDTGGGIFNMINSLNEENFMVFNPDTVWSIDYLNCIKEMENFYFSKKIQNILKKKIKIKKNSKRVKAPGQLKLHYSPGIPVKMNRKNAEKHQALIGFGKKFKVGKNYFNLSKKGNLKEAANNLYKTLREIRKRNFKSIAVVKIPNTEIGCAINDRLRKASNK